jgi:hypothetical protein
VKASFAVEGLSLVASRVYFLVQADVAGSGAAWSICRLGVVHSSYGPDFPYVVLIYVRCW